MAIMETAADDTAADDAIVIVFIVIFIASAAAIVVSIQSICRTKVGSWILFTHFFGEILADTLPLLKTNWGVYIQIKTVR